MGIVSRTYLNTEQSLVAHGDLLCLLATLLEFPKFESDYCDTEMESDFAILLINATLLIKKWIIKSIQTDVFYWQINIQISCKSF